MTDDSAWYDRQRRELEEAYLASGDPYAQSGFNGDAVSWERARRVIVRAVDRDGTFLDVGCANGLLMESVQRWAGEEHHEIEPYGMDLSERLVELAQRRYPQWADRLWVGNAIDWVGPMRFDFVHVLADAVPDHRRPELVRHLLARVVSPGGRLIVSSYGSSTRAHIRAVPMPELLGSWGYDVAGGATATADNGTIITRTAWVDDPRD